MSRVDDLLFAWRGWVLAACFAVVAAARVSSVAPLRPEALVLAGLGLVWRLQAGRFISGHSNGLRIEAGPLATGGPYAFGRHPLYLSNLATAAGLILFANCLPVWAMAALFAGACAHHALLARAEERRLLSAHGDAYLGYMRVTPRWLGIPGRGASGAGKAAAGDAGLGAALRRQGGNLGKTLAMFLAVWGLA
jgi:protein-S-isoprenylcysteine O-methyltransferase Ste14